MDRKLFCTLMVITSLFIIGCEPLTMSVMNAGASAGISAGINGIVYKTFTKELDPLNEVTLNALRNMDFIVKRTLKKRSMHEIHAVRAARKIIITLEPVSRKVTQMKIVVWKNFYSKDPATALEIIAQAEKILAL